MFEIQHRPDIREFGHFQLASKRKEQISRVERMIFLPYYKYERKIMIIKFPS